METIRWLGMGALVMAAAGCMATEEDLAALDETGATEGAALAQCTWGGADYVRKGFFFSKTDGSVVSPLGGTVYRYTPSRGSSTFDSLSAGNLWGGGDYTWAGDINQDGYTDLISARGSSVYVHKYFSNDHTAGFDTRTWATNDRWGGAGYTFLADFSGDGKPDIVSGSGRTLLYRKTNATATDFTAPLITVGNDGRWGGSGFTFAGDFNGDGKADIASFDGTSAFMKLKSTNDDFRMETWGVTSHWSGDGHTYMGDVNGDGRQDIVTVDGITVTTHRANQTGTNFTSISFNDGAVSWGGAGYTWLADFDDDGADDLVTVKDGFAYMFFGKKGAWSGTPFRSNRATKFALANFWLGDTAHTFAGRFVRRIANGVEVSAGADIVTFSGCSARVYRFNDGSDGSRTTGFDNINL